MVMVVLLRAARSATKLRNGSRLASDSAKSRSWKSRRGSGGMFAVGEGAALAAAVVAAAPAAPGEERAERDERGERDGGEDDGLQRPAPRRLGVSPARVERNAVARHSTSTSSLSGVGFLMWMSSVLMMRSCCPTLWK